MCYGWYKSVGSGSKKRPVVEVGIQVPDEHDRVVWREFLIDTGADRTAITKFTNRRLHGLPTDETESLAGIGTSSDDDLAAELFTGETLLALPEPQADDVYHLERLDELAIIEDAPVDLLGRDVLNRFVSQFDPERGRVEMDRRSGISPAPETVTISE